MGIDFQLAPVKGVIDFFKPFGLRRSGKKDAGQKLNFTNQQVYGILFNER